MKIYGLIGRSLGHSFSGKYFFEKFRKENIVDCEYRNFEIRDLNTEIPGLKKDAGLQGLNVTIPYKTAILPFLDRLSDECSRIQACNCIKIKNGKWEGLNTDVAGFEQSFTPHLKPIHQKAIILGTGGASLAVAYVLQKLNIDFLKASRSKRNVKSVISYDDITVKTMNDFQIFINTTPLGTFPNINECPSLPYEHITSQHYFFDLVYNPSKTLFLSLAEKKGATVENGSKMLAIQAEESWKIWNADNQ